MRTSRKPSQLGLVFWTAQLVGWGLFFAIAAALTAAAATGQATRPEVVLAYLCFCGTGLASSTLLWRFMRHWALTHGATRIIALALPAALLAAIVWGLLNDVLLFVLFDRPFPQPLNSKTLAGLFMLFILMIAWQAIALTGHFVSRAREAQAQARASEAASGEARLLALQHQLDPHFLFNAINAIVGLIDEDKQRAQRVLTGLAELLRSSFGAEAIWPLERELELVDRYLAIQVVRFDEDLQITTNISDAVRERTVPALALQLLVENAIKHGLRTSDIPLRVRLAAQLTERGELLLEVANSGSLEQQAAAPGGGDAGLGLANLRERLRHLFPNAHAFDLSEQDGWVRAQLRLARAAREA